MMTEQRTELDSFQTLLWSLYGHANEADLLQKARAKAWDRFLELGLPGRKDEAYKYLRLNYFYAGKYCPPHPATLTAETVDPYILPECRESVFVFVNGYFSQELSRVSGVKRLVALPLSDAMRTYGGFINSQWAKVLKDETDAFAALNAALHSAGLFLYLPPKVVIESPVQVLNIVSPDAQSTMYILPRLQVFAGTQTQISLVSTQAVLSEGLYTFNMAADIAMEEDSHVSCTQILCGMRSDVWHFEALRATLKRNCVLKTVAITDGAASVRNDYRVALCGENAEASLNGVCMLDGRNEAHTHVIIDHQAPCCRSMQLFKGALSGSSHSSFEGKILVRQAAQKTEAFQLNNNLLLSDDAHADSKPNLEIFADDVKASHGATFGQLDKEQIFYMRARGFDEAVAKNLLVYGFCQEVIDMVPIRSVHDAMKAFARSYRTITLKLGK